MLVLAPHHYQTLPTEASTTPNSRYAVQTSTAESTPEETDNTADESSDADTDDTDVEPAEAEVSGQLVIWADEKRLEPLQAIGPAFTEATGVELVVDIVPFDDIREQVTQAAPAGEGPDIFLGAHDWTGELAANGVIDAIDLSAKQDSFLDSALAGFNFEGATYALPYVTEAIGMYRNTDLVSDAPTTWEELEAACADITVENCVVLPGGGDAGDAYHNYPFLSAFGGFIFAFDDSTGFDASVVGLDNPESLKGIEFLESQVTSGTVASTNYDGAKNLFLEGQAAFWITGPWELNSLDEQDSVSWAASVIPQIDSQPIQPFVGAQGFFLNSFSDNTLLAQSFLNDFVATDETMESLYAADPRGTAWVSVAETLAGDPLTEAFSASAANGIPMPNIPQMGAVWGPLGDNILLVRNGELSSADAMTAAAEAVRSAVEG